MDWVAASEGDVHAEMVLPDADATSALGRALGAGLESGDGVALCGDLGAGKTTLARAIAHGLAVDDPTAVTSPTYLIVVEHPGTPPLIHVDAYLPEKTRAFLLDGGVDYLDELGGVVVVEWGRPGRGPSAARYALGATRADRVGRPPRQLDRWTEIQLDQQLADAREVD